MSKWPPAHQYTHTYTSGFWQVRKIKVDKCNSIVNALNRTKEVSKAIKLLT